MSNVYDYSVPTVDGGTKSLRDFQGKVILIVNTATGCGFTPQYEPLEKMYEDLHEKGLEIVDIPCNQFYGQAPGSDEEIHEFCTLHYHTTFAQYKKSDVNGDNQLDLYRYLKSVKGFEGFSGPMAAKMNDLLSKVAPDYMTTTDIKWNFTKFVVDREGNVVKRFEPTADMADVRAYVESLL